MHINDPNTEPVELTDEPVELTDDQVEEVAGGVQNVAECGSGGGVNELPMPGLFG